MKKIKPITKEAELLAEFVYVIEPLIPGMLLERFQESIREFEKQNNLPGLYKSIQDFILLRDQHERGIITELEYRPKCRCNFCGGYGVGYKTGINMTKQQLMKNTQEGRQLWGLEEYQLYYGTIAGRMRWNCFTLKMRIKHRIK